MKTIILLISILLSIIPISIIGYFFYKRDTIKESKKMLSKLFISGILSGIIVILISVFGIFFFPSLTNIEKINNLLILLFYCYIFVAFLEETSKFYMIYKISYNSKEFDQAYDIILYSVFVGLGFATFENIIYIFGNPNITTAFLRSLTAVPAHVCFQTFMGYFLFLNKTKTDNHNIILSILIPILLHGTYDFLIFTGSNIMIIFDLIFLIIIIYLSTSIIKKLLIIDKNNLQQFCINCGTRINYSFCPNCGQKKQ